MIRKFRVWAKKNKKWRYYKDDYILKPSGEIWEYNCDYDSSVGFVDYLVEPVEKPIVEFYTGLEDTNGREIYEGDIVKALVVMIGVETWVVGTIELLGPSFCFVDTRDGNWGTIGELSKSPVVIGNIHENPELLS